MHTEHGGNLAEARRLFPDAPEPRLDLSTGVNPTAYPTPPSRPDRLPEPADLLVLEHAAATAYRLAPEAQAIAGPGTGPILAILALLARTDAAIVGPTYAGHARAWSAAGARIHDVPDLQAALATDAPTIILTRPNNPDGRIEPILPTQGRLLIVDEAFADLEPIDSLPPRASRPGLIILRSFGKTYGLPGLRLSFALGADPLLARLRTALGPWPVSAAAIEAGLAALPDTAWRDTQRTLLATAATRLDHILTTAGLHILGGTTLFRLASHPHAQRLWSHLGRAGILARRFDAFPDRLRFGIPPEPGFARLTRALPPPLAQALEKPAIHQ